LQRAASAPFDNQLGDSWAIRLKYTMLSGETTHILRTERPRHLVRYFLIADFFYLALVHAWGVGVRPLGRDFALLENPAQLAWPLRSFVSAEVLFFGDIAPLYHVVNLALLFGCMAAVFFLTLRLVGGPVWLASLAAVLLMANPVKSEATLHLTGAADLLPAFLGLTAVACFVRHGQVRTARSGVVAWTLLVGAVLLFRENVCLALPLVLHERMVVERRRSSRLRAAMLTALTLVACGLYWSPDMWNALDPLRMFAPLGLLPYPIGLLPETASQFHASPALAYGALVLAIVFLVYLDRRVRAPVFTFAAASLFAVRLLRGGLDIDPVHMTGGGALIVPLGFFSIGVAALCRRIMLHPRWPRPVVLLTTAICVLLFLLQVTSLVSWRRAARETARFQQQAYAFAAEHPEQMLGVLPDYRCLRGAPMNLSDAIAHDTPFSRSVHHMALLPLHYPVRGKVSISVTAWEARIGVVRIEGVPPAEVLPEPYAEDGHWRGPGTEMWLDNVTPAGFDVVIKAVGCLLPGRCLPISPPVQDSP